MSAGAVRANGGWSLVVALAMGILATPALADRAASGPWRTLESEHLRIHFPPPAEPFARAVAERAEGVRSEVARIVGHVPERKIDIVVGDLSTDAAGRALPFNEGARITLRPAPPASTDLRAFDDWIALALGHELAHVAHLSRPPEQRALRFVAQLLPAQPLVLRLPTWVAESYATYVEGALACAASPPRPFDAALLAAIARARRLPDDDELAAGTAWPGTAASEAVGAAFLAWLEERHGEGALADVWTRMTAASPRRFRSAFRHRFGATAPELYDRFVAELEAAAPPPSPSTAPVLAAAVAGAPDVAADGRRVVAVRRSDRHPRLVIHAPGGDPLAEVASLALAADAMAVDPRWLADGSVLFAQPASADGGGRRSDLFVWRPQEDEVRRVTRGAGLHAPDPAADGTWAVAVASRWGVTSLVRVDLGSGAVETLVPGELEAVIDAPRLSPDGRRLAYLRHRDGAWRVVVRDLATGAESFAGEGAAPILAWPAWSPDGEWLAVTVGAAKELRVEAWGADGAGRRRLSAPGALAFAPTFHRAAGPAPPELLYLRLDLAADANGGAGSGAVRLERRPWSPTAPGNPAQSFAAPGAGDAACVALDPTVPPSRPYGRGPTTYSSLLGGSSSPSNLAYTGGWRGGDVIGRWEAVAIAGVSEEGAESGGIVSGAWRGWRLPLEMHGYSVERRPSQQPETVPGLGERLDVLDRTFAVETAWSRERERRRLDLGAAVLASKLTPGIDGETTLERYAVRLAADGAWNRELSPRVDLRYGAGLVGVAAWTDSESWSRHGGDLRLGLDVLGASRRYSVDATWSRLAVDDAVLDHDRLILGGIPSSLVPAHLDLSRVYEAALPAGTAIGDRWQAQRLELGREATPVRLFWARHRLWDDGGDRGDWIALAGAEIFVDRDPRPILRLPSSRVRVGAAHVFDAPFEGEWMFWAGLAWTL